MDQVSLVLGGGAGWAAVAVTAYVGLGLVAAAAERVPGLRGAAATVVLGAYPRLLRAGLRAAVAAAVGASVLDGGAALADSGQPRPTLVAPVVAREAPVEAPVVAPAVPVADPLDWPVVRAAPRVPRPQAATVAPTSDQQVVVVRRGDSLWSLAADALGSEASVSAVAAAWPQWWVANRRVIGPDPDRLRPGLHLHVPAPERNPS